MMDYRASLAPIAVLASAALLAPSNARAQRTPAPTTAPAPAQAIGRTGYPRHAPSNGIRVNTSRARTQRANADASASNTGGANSLNAADSFGFAGGYPLSLQDLLGITPTNGFDWQFINAIDQDLPMKALIDPVTQLEVAQAERLFGSTGGAFSGAYLLGGGYGYYPPPETDQPPGEQQAPPPNQPSQPQIIVLQQAPAQQATEQESSEASAEEQIPDQGQLTLVLRNGREIQAVAFTHAGDKIFYITPDGSRLSIPTSELNADATIRINQEKGTPLELNL
jgi:hypothetical protein